MICADLAQRPRWEFTVAEVVLDMIALIFKTSTKG